MRKAIQRPRLSQLTHEDPPKPEGIRMRVLWQELQPAGGIQHARAHTHGREAALLSPLR